ncbi:alpha/beta hydrolase [Pectinatus cerevisiiphilus]|uniref:Carboxylesterase n=1 Tax=Pectinatus cerevisiiphilus TaxID=86956 RepID=A0A4R3K871_9FIRM|nr:alpha/beta fold hydrolase [Pectinatus cerevisiiphilus]TCS78983.1 carboxylesterase [Pectinatus cerevisiiphilus]
MILHGAEPFFLPGGKHGVLLIHGFTGTPAEMLLLGKYLNRLGYTVMGIRLAGHGTTPSDMARTSWKDWYHSVCDGYYLLKGRCSSISVIGLSMGGALALILSTNLPVEKVVSLSTPVFISAERGLNLLPSRQLSKNVYVPKMRRKFPTIPEYYNISYKKMPLICVHELLDCIRHLKNNLDKVTVPTLIVQSKNDRTVDNRSGQYIYSKIKSIHKKILQLEKSGHLVILDMEKETVFKEIEKFMLKRT